MQLENSKNMVSDNMFERYHLYTICQCIGVSIYDQGRFYEAETFIYVGYEYDGRLCARNSEILIRDHGLELAYETIIHSDQGDHYTCLLFIDILKNKSLRMPLLRK